MGCLLRQLASRAYRRHLTPKDRQYQYRLHGEKCESDHVIAQRRRRLRNMALGSTISCSVHRKCEGKSPTATEPPIASHRPAGHQLPGRPWLWAAGAAASWSGGFSSGGCWLPTPLGLLLVLLPLLLLPFLLLAVATMRRRSVPPVICHLTGARRCSVGPELLKQLPGQCLGWRVCRASPTTCRTAGQASRASKGGIQVNSVIL